MSDESRYLIRDFDVFERVPTPGLPDAAFIVNRTRVLRRQMYDLWQQAGLSGEAIRQLQEAEIAVLERAGLRRGVVVGS